MRNRKFHTSINLLIEPDTYQRMKMIATLQKTTMSQFIRDGIKLRMAQYDKENNSITIENSNEQKEK
jgi:hypothetical protein